MVAEQIYRFAIEFHIASLTTVKSRSSISKHETFNTRRMQYERINFACHQSIYRIARADDLVLDQIPPNFSIGQRRTFMGR